jgi:ABC-type uncharacterized transport system involved in gliding motility auxiliary subunit
VLGILRAFEPEGRQQMLAARVTGMATTAFPDGPPASDNDEVAVDEAATGPLAHLHEASKPINVIVVADTDLLFDRFWVNTTDFFGQPVNVPTANNGDFVLNALENLSAVG